MIVASTVLGAVTGSSIAEFVNSEKRGKFCCRVNLNSDSVAGVRDSSPAASERAY